MTGSDPLFLALQEAVIGRYSLEREIGRGGMGIVYLARDVALDRPVAIKLLPPDRAELADIRARFLREARIAAGLSHPNIVPIHAVEEHGRLVFFVMAYVAGTTLADRIRTQGPLQAAEAGRILRDVAWALGYAHQQGVIHRDIKADNILLEAASRRTLVTDFGIAQPLGEQDDAPFAGTVAYMSPEQADGGPLDGRSDLYSLGVVGYLLLSGRLPWPAGTVEQLRQLRSAGRPAPLGRIAPHVPRALARAVERCLAPDPADRFRSAEEVAAALDELSAGPVDLPAPLRVWLTADDRSRSGVLMWTIGMGLPIISIVLSSFRWGVPLTMAYVLGAGLVMPWLAFGATRLGRTRKVLAAGYSRADLVLAIRQQAERRREELAFEIGSPPTRFGRLLRRLAWLSLAGTGVVSAASLLTSIPGPIVLQLFVGTSAVALVSALLGTIVPGRKLPARHRQSWRERFWNGPAGRLVTRLAGWKLGRRATPELTLHRPTEVALGEAADALFQALPAAHRQELAELPARTQYLAGEARRLRREIEALDRLIADAAPSTVFGDRPAGDGGAAELIAARDIWAGQLQETVALLEALRVGLLKLHAGSIAPVDLTSDLAAARTFADRLGRLAGAYEDLGQPLVESHSTG